MSKQLKPSFRELKAELDAILADLQAGDLDIDEATKAYERGMKLIAQLEKYLKATGNTVAKIKASFERQED